MLYTLKRSALSLLQSTHLKEELTGYYFVLKASRVFPIRTQAEQTKDGEHFAND